MIPDTTVYRRTLRRETHAARTVPASIVATIAALVLLAALAAAVWAMIDPRFADRLAGYPESLFAQLDPRTTGIVAGALLLLLAVLLIAAALLPGRRSRRARVTDRIALLVDDGVLADATSTEVAERCGLDPSHVSVTVGRQSVAVRLKPLSGSPIDERAASAAAEETLGAVGFDTAVRLRVAEQGVVS